MAPHPPFLEVVSLMQVAAVGVRGQTHLEAAGLVVQAVAEVVLPQQELRELPTLAVVRVALEPLLAFLVFPVRQAAQAS